jgi:hypothetical protein
MYQFYILEREGTNERDIFQMHRPGIDTYNVACTSHGKRGRGPGRKAGTSWWTFVASVTSSGPQETAAPLA